LQQEICLSFITYYPKIDVGKWTDGTCLIYMLINCFFCLHMIFSRLLLDGTS
jgi:hypothetical protein